MSPAKTMSGPDTEAIREFLTRTPPFNTLSPITIDGVVARCGTEHAPKGATILQRGQSVVNHLRLVYEGRVKVFLKGEQGEVSLEYVRGSGEAIGHLAILRGSLSNLDVHAIEDSVFLTIAKDDFLELVGAHLSFSSYYLKALSEGYVGKALDTLERTRISASTQGSLYLFSAQVGDIVRRRPVVISAYSSISEAARTMTMQRVGCLLVKNTTGKIIGIMTDRDLRTKVLAQGLDPETTVEKIMASPLQTVPSHTVCFDALMDMMRRRVHHLVLEKAGQIIGVLSGHDLMVLQGSSPLFMIRTIRDQQTVEGLFDIALQSPRIVRTLILEGAKPRHITRMITLINDTILDRLLYLLQQILGDPPVPYCWLLMGSEGRQEQTFRTDQDNGIIYRDPESEAERKAAAEYFEAFGQQAVSDLVASGFPLCKGGIMASNPKWCQPYSVWQKYFDYWIRKPNPHEVMLSTIFFDFRPGCGDLELGHSLRDYLMAELKGQEVFLRFLARDSVTTAPAISFFRQFNVEKNGPYKNKLDIKIKGITPFVDFARLMSLQAGIAETNTLERLQILAERKRISEELMIQASQAFEFQMNLRLLHQQELYEEALEPDNFIDPESLSDLDRRTLKDSLSVINDLKAVIKDAFILGAG